MNISQRQVKEFHEQNGFGVNVGLGKRSLYLITFGLFVKFLAETLRWTYRVLLRIGIQKSLFFRAHIILEECSKLLIAMGRCDEIQIADGIADSIYVILGAAVIYNIPVETVYNEVHRSNMTKGFIKGIEKRVAGVYKGNGYEPPDIETAIYDGRKTGVGGTEPDLMSLRNLINILKECE